MDNEIDKLLHDMIDEIKKAGKDQPEDWFGPVFSEMRKALLAAYDAGRKSALPESSEK